MLHVESRRGRESLAIHAVERLCEHERTRQGKANGSSCRERDRTFAIEIQRVCCRNLEDAVRGAQWKDTKATRPAFRQKCSCVGTASTKIGHGNAEPRGSVRQNRFVRAEPGGDDGLPQWTAVDRKRRNWLLSHELREQRTEPPFVRPGGIHHAVHTGISADSRIVISMHG